MELIDLNATITLTNREAMLLLVLVTVGVSTILGVIITTINKYIKWR